MAEIYKITRLPVECEQRYIMIYVQNGVHPTQNGIYICAFNSEYDLWKYIKTKYDSISVEGNFIVFSDLNDKMYKFPINQLETVENTYTSLVKHKISMLGGSMRYETDVIKQVNSVQELLELLIEMSK